MSRIKEIRESEGLSMAKFAERLGVSHGSISLLESGKRNLTPQMAKLISKEFKVNETWLLTGDGSMHDEPDPEDEIAALAVEMYNLDPNGWAIHTLRKIARLSAYLSEDDLNTLTKVAEALAKDE